MKFEITPEGFWQVGEESFFKKFDALVYATKIKQPVKFIFFDHVWDSFDRSLLGKFSSKELYKQRALQLREEYDYLIVYFSGGADSYNVIRSFIDNGIPLDEVCVKWSMAAIDAGVYTPNDKDTRPRNILSEWDYAIKPVLDWLVQEHPEIKITVVDWTENLHPNIYKAELFQKVNSFTDVEIPFMVAYSPSEEKYINLGKKVASIYGIEKPKIGYDNGKWYMGFLDGGTGMGVPSDINPFGTEYFYWSPKFPILAFQQAYEVINYLEATQDYQKYFFTKAMPTLAAFRKIAQIEQNRICKLVLYDNWIDSFQAEKPFVPDRADKHFWIFEHPELRNVRDSFIDMNSLFLSQIHRKFLLNVYREDDVFDKSRGIYKHCWSKWHYIKDHVNPNSFDKIILESF
jgi:hypothetical protein